MWAPGRIIAARLGESYLSAPAPDGEGAQDSVEDASFALEDLIPAGIILAVAIVVAIALRYVIERVLRSHNAIIARLVARTVAGVAVIIGLVYALSSLDIRVGLLLGALGIGGFALAFAMRDTLENFISGVILQIRQPFGYDDTVEIGDYAGTVTDINLRAVEMTVFSGEKVIIPSKDVLQNPIENWTANSHRRLDIEVGVSYDADIHETCRLITEALSDVEGSVDDPAPDAVFDGFGDSSINLKGRVWFESTGPYFDVQRDAAARIKHALDGAGIDIPFPTRTVLGAGGADDRTADDSAEGDELPAPEPDDRVTSDRSTIGADSEAGDHADEGADSDVDAEDGHDAEG